MATTATHPSGIAMTRRFALIWGIAFLVVGAAGFVPGLLTPDTVPLAVDTLHGRLFGLFPVNILHSLVHVAFGVWGIAAWRSFGAARTYAKAVAVIYAVLAVMGFIPGLDTLFGLVPLHAHDIWLHLVLAVPAAYIGFRPLTEQTGPVGAAREERSDRP